MSTGGAYIATKPVPAGAAPGVNAIGCGSSDEPPSQPTTRSNDVSAWTTETDTYEGAVMIESEAAAAVVEAWCAAHSAGDADGEGLCGAHQADGGD